MCSLSAYSAYLVESQKLHHSLTSPAASQSDSSHLEHLPRQPTLQSPLDNCVKGQEPDFSDTLFICALWRNHFTHKIRH